MNEYSSILNKSLSLTCLCTVPVSVFFLIHSRECIGILGGNDYYGAVLCMQILMPILIVSGVSSVTGNQVLLPNGMDTSFLRAVSVGAVIDVVLNVVLMPRYGCSGAAFATLIAEFAQMMLQVFFSRHYIKNSVSKLVLTQIIIATSVAVFCIITMRNVLEINDFVTIVIDFIVYAILYILVLFMLKNKFVYNYIITLKRRFHDAKDSNN